MDSGQYGTKSLILWMALLIAVPVAAGPLTFTTLVSLPGDVVYAADGLSATARLGTFVTGGFEVNGVLSDDRFLDASIATNANGQTFIDEFGDDVAVDGGVTVELSWLSAPLVILGGSGHGYAYFDTWCLGSMAYCTSNVDIATGQFEFEFGVPFRLEMATFSSIPFTSVENVSESTLALLDTNQARITDLDGNPLDNALLIRGPSLGPTETPEPSTFALAAFGLAAWGLARRLRRPRA